MSVHNSAALVGVQRDRIARMTAQHQSTGRSARRLARLEDDLRNKIKVRNRLRDSKP